MEKPKIPSSNAGLGRSFEPLNFAFQPEKKPLPQVYDFGQIEIITPAAVPAEFHKSEPDGDSFAGLGGKTEPEGHFTKGHHKHGGSCECSGSECKCADGSVGKLAFKPGQKVRHKLTGRIYEMVKTLCVTADECFCLMKSNGKVDECLIYPDEVTAI